MVITSSKHYLFGITTGCMAVFLWGTALAAVSPPPLPLGSSMIKVQSGLSEVERKRQERAHHHKLQVKKDVTRDDTLDTPTDTPPQGKSKKPIKETP